MGDRPGYTQPDIGRAVTLVTAVGSRGEDRQDPAAERRTPEDQGQDGRDEIPMSAPHHEVTGLGTGSEKTR